MDAIVWVRKPNKEETDILTKEPTWEHEPETWDAEYNDGTETFLVLEGKCYITLPDRSMFRFEAGDIVTVKDGTKCTWTVEKKIKKHYIFNM